MTGYWEHKYWCVNATLKPALNASLPGNGQAALNKKNYNNLNGVNTEATPTSAESSAQN